VEVLEGSMEGKHLVITCTLTTNNQEIPTHALINCGATGIAFMDQDFTRHHQIPLQELKEKWKVEVINRRPIQSGDLTHVAKVGMMIQDHKKQLPRFVTKLGDYAIVLRNSLSTITWCCSTICIQHCYFWVPLLHDILPWSTRYGTRSYRGAAGTSVSPRGGKIGTTDMSTMSIWRE